MQSGRQQYSRARGADATLVSRCSSKKRVFLPRSLHVGVTSDKARRHHIVAYTSLTTGRTVTPPIAASIAGREYVIKDESGAARASNITIATTASQTIDGASTKTINTNYGVVRVYSNGSHWFTY